MQQFLDRSRRNHVTFKKIVVFEPENINYAFLKRFFGKKKNIILVKKGLSNDEDILYLAGEGVSARIGYEGDTVQRIPVTSIDLSPECQDATWIKLDIEGAEMDALHGAQNVIRRNHPKLTICIYHSDEDMIRIAEYIHELVPEYKLYVRHHMRAAAETVLYAVL